MLFFRYTAGFTSARLKPVVCFACKLSESCRSRKILPQVLAYFVVSKSG